MEAPSTTWWLVFVISLIVFLAPVILIRRCQQRREAVRAGERPSRVVTHADLRSFGQSVRGYIIDRTTPQVQDPPVQDPPQPIRHFTPPLYSP